MAEIKLRWEFLDDFTSRAEVFGGWLVKVENTVVHNLTMNGQDLESGFDWRPALTFVPDPKHEWGREKYKTKRELIAEKEEDLHEMQFFDRD